MPNPTPQEGQRPDVRVEITASPNPVRLRHRLTLTIVIRNAGLTTEHGVTVTKTLPPHIVLQSVKSSEGECSVMGDEVTCRIGTMPPGSMVTITVVVRPLRAGPLVESEVAAAAFEPKRRKNREELTVIIIPASAAGRKL